MTKEEHYQERMDIGERVVYTLIGNDIAGILADKGYLATNEQLDDIVDYFEERFEQSLINAIPFYSSFAV